MIKDFATGFNHAWSGLFALTTPGLRRFVIWPVVISIVVFTLVIAVAATGIGGLIAWLLGWLPGWLDWLQWLLLPLFALAALLIGIYSFTLLANLVGAPFNGLLAARYENHLLGEPPPSDERPILAAGLSSLANEIRKLAYLARWLFLAALLFLIPLVNIIAPLVWVSVGAWLLALEYIGYPMDNHALDALDARRQRRILAGRRSMALGFGAGVMFLSTVPLLNLLAMPAAVLGATSLWCELGQQARQLADEPS